MFYRVEQNVSLFIVMESYQDTAYCLLVLLGSKTVQKNEVFR